MRLPVLVQYSLVIKKEKKTENKFSAPLARTVTHKIKNFLTIHCLFLPRTIGPTCYPLPYPLSLALLLIALSSFPLTLTGLVLPPVIKPPCSSVYFTAAIPAFAHNTCLGLPLLPSDLASDISPSTGILHPQSGTLSLQPACNTPPWRPIDGVVGFFQSVRTVF